MNAFIRVRNRPMWIFISAILTASSALAAQRTWNNTGTDFNSAGSWTGGVPAAGDVALFTTERGTQPNLSASRSIAGLLFQGTATANYDITNTNSAVLTLTGSNTTGSGGSDNTTAAAIRSEPNGSGNFNINAIDAPIALAPATGTTSTFFQQAGGKLRIGGAISGSGITLNLAGTGNIELDLANTYSGGTTISGSINLVIINSNSLGTGPVSFNASSSISGGGIAIQLPNAVTLAADITVSGTTFFDFDSSVTASGAATRTLTLTNSAATNMTAILNLAESDAVSRTFLINGTGSMTIDALIRNNSAGNAMPSALTKSGGGTLTILQPNTYSGVTTVNGGTLVAGGNGALGKGNVSVASNGATLRLEGGSANNYIADSAGISIVNGAVANLNFTGVPDVVSSITLNGVAQTSPGTYGGPSSNATFKSSFFAGTGTLNLRTLYMLSIARSGNNMVVTFQAVAGGTYHLQYKNLITDANWTDTGSDLAVASTGPAQLTDVNGGLQPMRFYRVRPSP